MKVLQILLDGYSPFNKTSCYDYEEAAYEYYDKDYIKNLLSNKGLEFTTVKSIDTRYKVLKSPCQWAKCLGGDEFVENAHYTTGEKDRVNPSNYGYAQFPKENWIWNRLSEIGIRSFVVPYYVFNYMDYNNCVTNKSKDYTDLLTYGYYENNYRFNDKIIDTNENYHMICDGFDLLNSVSKNYVKEHWNIWKDTCLVRNRVYFSNELNEYINEIDNQSKNIIMSELYYNKDFYLNNIIPKITDKHQYVFIGDTDTDAIAHYKQPYGEYWYIINRKVTEMLIKLSKFDFDLIIIHGDHGMDPTTEIRRKHKARTIINGKSYLCFSASANGKIPMFCTHNNKICGDVYYKPKYKKLADYLKYDNSKTLLVKIREILLNKDNWSE